MIEHILTPFLNAGIDRFRGDGDSVVKADVYASALFAVAVSLIVPMDVYEILALAVAYKLGEAPGWGEPLGSYLNDREMTNPDRHWWIKGFLKTNVKAAMLVRGFMWGAPVSALAYFVDPILAAVTLGSFTINFLLAPYLIKKFRKDSERKWKEQEELRGLLTMLPISLYAYLTLIQVI